MTELRRLSTMLDAARELPATPRPQPQGGSDLLPLKVNGVSRPIWERATFESFDLKATPAMRPAMAACKKVVSGEEWCAFLVGSPGNGKTHLAVGAMHAFEDQRAYFWKVSDFLEWLRATAYGQKIGILGTVRSYVEQSFLLVLDDLGVERDTEFGSEELYRIIDQRYELKLPTIVTSNQPPDRIDARLSSRLASGLVVCSAPDYRRKKGVGGELDKPA